MGTKNRTSATIVDKVLRQSRPFTNIWKRIVVKDLSRKFLYDIVADMIIDILFTVVIYAVRGLYGVKLLRDTSWDTKSTMAPLLRRKKTSLSFKRSLVSFVVESLATQVHWVGIWNPIWVSGTMFAVIVEKPLLRKDTGMTTTTWCTWDWWIILVNIVESPLEGTTLCLPTWSKFMGPHLRADQKDCHK